MPENVGKEAQMKKQNHLNKCMRITAVILAAVIFMSTVFTLSLRGIAIDSDTANQEPGFEIGTVAESTEELSSSADIETVNEEESLVSESEYTEESSVMSGGDLAEETTTADPVEETAESFEETAESTEESAESSEETVESTEESAESFEETVESSEEPAESSEESLESSGDAAETTEDTEASENSESAEEDAENPETSTATSEAETEPSEETAPSFFSGALTAEYGEDVHVLMEIGEEAEIPAGASLSVRELTGEEYEAYLGLTTEFMEAEAFSYARIFDICILNSEGVEIEPAAPVQVSIELDDAEDTEEDFSVLHFGEETEEMQAVTDGNTVSFEAEAFSAYAIVKGPDAVPLGWEKVTTMAAFKELASQGLYIGQKDGYFVLNTTEAYKSDNKITGIKKSGQKTYPGDDGVKYYFEAVENTENQFYIYCYDSSNNKQYVSNTAESASLILSETKTAYTVSVNGSGQFSFQGNGRYWNMRGGAGGNIFAAYEKLDNGGYFYLWQFTENESSDPYGLDGKSYGLMYWVDGTNGKAMMSTATENHLDGLSLTVMSKAKNGAKLYVPDNSDISFWTFDYIEEDFYYLTSVVDGSTKYLSITASGPQMVSMPDDGCKIQVVPGTGANAGTICLKNGGKTLAYSGKIENGFTTGGKAGMEWLRLVEESELDNSYFMTYSAEKVSVSDSHITNGSRVIVYTRVWNDTAKKYEFYAVDHDGSLVRVYESGDSIEWVGGRLNSMLWNFVEYYWEGSTDPNYFYELYNQYSESYLAPQKSNGQILSPNTIGINMNGRRYGRYYSPIVAWDEGYYAYAGLKADKATNSIVSCPISEADDFYFAIVQDIPVDDKLTTVPTVDHTQYGITMKMVNFGTDLYKNSNGASANDANVRKKMSDFLGSDNNFHQYSTEPGLLKTQLGDDDYPVSKKDNSLSEWFENAEEVNHLFIASTYNGTGYYEYDSVQNFAHLDPETKKFVVYKELGSDSDTGVTHRHGLFFPYNDIVAGVYSQNKNTTTISSQALSESDPRKYETMYQVQKSTTNFAPDYYFGVELTATFTQTPNGLDDWGHDIIYEFTGDDDFWLFVDGELIIDLGGIHSAISGDVNYKTGVVHVNGRETTLKTLFKENYKNRNLEAANEQVNAYLDKIFDGEIFKDYTTHTMKIYYLERGAGSSNLHMRFNLASIKPGTAQLTKHLSGVESNETVLAEFPYQILYQTRKTVTKEDGTSEEVLTEHYLTNSVAGDPARMKDRVFYKDTTTAVPYYKAFTVGGKTYNDVFILKPEETADINFPLDEFSEGEKFVSYKVIECGVNTAVYSGVDVNGTALEGEEVKDSEGNTIANRKDYGIDYASTNDRARVVYTNEVSENAYSNLEVTKELYDVNGTRITNDPSVFNFRLYLATETGDIGNSPANMHTYHVKDASGNYCYWNVDQQRIMPLEGEKKDYTQLTAAQKEAATFHTSMNGSITRIPVDYTIEVRDLLVGTKFKVVERPSEIPDGYSFRKYVYLNKGYTDALTGVTHTIEANEGAQNVIVENFKGFGLRVNKVWTDADYMEERDAAYFGIFYRDRNGALQPVSGSLRQMSYGESSIYWYYDQLPVEGVTDFTKYEIYEVTLTKPEVDTEGKVTSYNSLTVLNDNDQVTLDGRQIGDETATPFTYTVSYDREENSTDDNVRVDTVTNSRPGIVLKKVQWNETTALPGAAFTLTDSTGRQIGTYTSDKEGLITEAYLRTGVDYTLTETSAPQGWHGLEKAMTLRLESNGELTVAGVEQAYYTVNAAAQTEDGKVVLSVKNRPYKLQIVKMDQGTEQPLKGVEFALYRQITVDNVQSWDPNPCPGFESLVSGEDGVLPKIDRTLPAGTYELRETKALSGYKTLSGYVDFTISQTGAVTVGKLPEEAVFEEPTVQKDGSILYRITITNSKEYEVSIWKTNEGYETLTLGAEFELYPAASYDDEAGTVKGDARPIVSDKTGTNGILRLGKLTVGDYRLVETAAPAGYNSLTEAVRITVSNDGVTAWQSNQPAMISTKGGANSTDKDHWVSGQNANTWQIRVWNNPGVALPETGGLGVRPFLIMGALLLLSAAVLWIFKRKLS